MPLGDYLVGLLFAGIVFGAAAAAAVIVVVRRGRSFPLPVAVAAWALLGTTGVFACHLVPGMLGVLSREAAAVAALVVLAVAVLVPAAPRRAVEVPERIRSSGFSWALGVGALVLTAGYLLALALESRGDFPVSPDTVTFHLPNVARWIQSGSLWQVDDFVPNRASGNYPQTADVLHLAVILPWSRDFLMPLANFPLTALLGLALFCSARELRVPVPTAMLAAAAVLALPVVGYLTAASLADHAMYATFACGVLFLLRHWRTGDPFDLVLAGIGLGVAFGTRWYAVPAVAVTVAVWAAGWLAVRRPLPQLVRSAGAIAGLVALLGGFWLVRNWVESGNPVFPVKVQLAELVVFDAPHDQIRELTGFTLLDYADDPGVWTDVVWPTFVDLLALTSLMLLVGASAAAVLALRRVRRDGRVIALAAIALIVVAIYAITPYSAAGPEGDPRAGWVNTRYVGPALLLAAPATAWLLACAGRLRVPLEALVVVGTLDALRRSAELPAGDVGAVAVLFAAALIALVLGAFALARRRPKPARAAVAAAATSAGVLALVAGAVHADRYSDNWYRHFNPVVDHLKANAPRDARIGIVGDGWSNYPLFGRELENEVEFVGDRVDGMLRALDEPRTLVHALRSGDYDFVYFHDLDTLDPALPARQRQWLERAGFRQVASGVHPILGTGIALYEPPG